MLMTTVMCLSANYLYSQTTTPEHTPWDVGFSLGFSPSDDTPIVMGLHGAYYFKPKYGAGLLARRSYVDGYENLFFGAAFFANWGKSNSQLFFPTRIGIGVNKFTTPKNEFNEPALYVSAGIAYRHSKLISFGVFVDYASPFEDIEDFSDFEYFGINAGIRFHF